MPQTGASAPGEEAEPTTLSVDLREHADEVVALMMRPEAFAALGAGAPWLRERYAELAPALVPDALDCVGTGRHLSRASLDLIRDSALGARGSDVPLAIVLRGAVPALRAVATFARSSPRVPLSDVAVLVGRSALVAQELGACWAGHWADGVGTGGTGRRGGSAGGAARPGAEVAVVVSPAPADADDADAARPVEPDEQEVRMIALAADGRSTDQIAAELAYSPQAVKWHLGRLMRAWRVQNRCALVAAAFVRGVLVVSRRRPDDGPRQLGR